MTILQLAVINTPPLQALAHAREYRYLLSLLARGKK